MDDALNLAMFEFALDVQRLIQSGWTFTDLDYGERRLGIGPTITVKKEDRVVTIREVNDIEALLREENEVFGS